MGRFVSMEKYSKVADATDVSNDYVEFAVSNLESGIPSGMIAQIRADSTGVINTAGLAVTFDDGVVTVTATAISLGDVITLLVFDDN